MDAYIESGILVMVVYYWCFHSRGSRMAEMVSDRLQNMYNRWTNQSEQRAFHILSDSGKRLSTSSLQRLGSGEQRERQRRRNLEKEAEKQILDRQLFRIKEIPWTPIDAFRSRPFMGKCCTTCTPSSHNTGPNPLLRNLNVRNILISNYATGENGFLSKYFCDIVGAWKQKKYEYSFIYDSVLKDEKLKLAIEKAAKADVKELKTNDVKIYHELLKKHSERATKLLSIMRSTLSDIFLRITSWVFHKLLPWFVTSVASHPAQVEMLHNSAKTGLPLIFLPLHRSHLDYILITFILFNNNIKCPLVAAGDNLNIPVFGWLLRKLGAFFIKRRLDPIAGKRDTVYREVLHTYMIECLRAGHYVEFFIEGGRTRTGKYCMPKAGLLSVIVDAYMDGTIEDALLVPVSLNYEKIVDGNFILEQCGSPKQMETFTNAVKSIWKILNSNYGIMRIDFNQPFSLREIIKTFQSPGKINRPLSFPDMAGGDAERANSVPNSPKKLCSTLSSASLFGTDVMVEEHRQMVDCIARHIIYDCCQATAVMSTNAVAFLLLNKFRKGTDLGVLVKALDDLRSELETIDKDVGFTGDSIDVINHVIGLLGPSLIKKEKISKQGQLDRYQITPITRLPNVLELSYYSNSLIPHFVLESVIVSALHSILPENVLSTSFVPTNTKLKILESDLIQASKDLCNILQFEFLFTKPCQCLESAIHEVIDNLKIKEILESIEVQQTEDEEWSRRFAKHLEDDESDNEDNFVNSPDLLVNVNKTSLEKFHYYHGLLRPLIDTYAASAYVLNSLVGREVEEQDLIHDILSEINTRLERGFVAYGESQAVDPIRNSLKLWERWEVIECFRQDKVKMYYLQDLFDSSSSVTNVHEKINRFRVALQ